MSSLLNMLKNEYPQFGAQYDVVHHTEYLNELIKNKRLTINHQELGSMTYHDSCYLGRWNGIYQAPREILRSVNGTGNLMEMPRSASKGFCCGAGGSRMFMEENIGQRININRADEVITTGAKTVLTACPFCMTMLSDGLLEKKAEVAVKDIVEIVDAATA
jgi:Fe-S oxidoreductase